MAGLRALIEAVAEQGAKKAAQAIAEKAPKVAVEEVVEAAPAAAKRAVAAAQGLLGTQKQSAWNHLTGEAPIKSAGAYQVRRGTPFSEGELADLQKITDSVGGDIPQVDPRGARVLEFGDVGSDSRSAMVKALREAYPDADVIPQARSGNLFPVDENWNAPEKYSTKPYIDKIEAAGPNVVAGFDEAMKTMAPKALEKTQAWAQKTGWTEAPWFETAMKGLAEGGLAKLKELQAAGVVPAVFLTDLASIMGEQEPQQP